jgi:hypothetical protein
MVDRPFIHIYIASPRPIQFISAMQDFSLEPSSFSRQLAAEPNNDINEQVDISNNEKNYESHYNSISGRSFNIVKYFNWNKEYKEIIFSLNPITTAYINALLDNNHSNNVNLVAVLQYKAREELLVDASNIDQKSLDSGVDSVLIYELNDSKLIIVLDGVNNNSSSSINYPQLFASIQSMISYNNAQVTILDCLDYIDYSKSNSNSTTLSHTGIPPILNQISIKSDKAGNGGAVLDSLPPPHLLAPLISALIGSILINPNIGSSSVYITWSSRDYIVESIAAFNSMVQYLPINSSILPSNNSLLSAWAKIEKKLTNIRILKEKQLKLKKSFNPNTGAKNDRHDEAASGFPADLKVSSREGGNSSLYL